MVCKGVNITLKIIACFVFANSGHAQTVKTMPIGDSVVGKVVREWRLPPILKEISGISYIDADRFACIQDEIGSIFIYNLSTSLIEDTIPFGPPGDYEGIATVGDNAYIACADGRIFEMSDYRSEEPVVKEYGTHLTVKQNAEGICYDKKNKRLLLVIKGEDDGGLLFKGIYEFGLADKKMPFKPALKINLQDPVFGKVSPRKNRPVYQPSEIAIHPLTGDIYITEGVRPQLLIMDMQSEKIKALHALEKFEINQPEGMLFTPSGDLYIASEGNKQNPGRIMSVQLKPVRD